MSDAQISLLGPARFRRASGYVPFSSAKATALIGYLAVKRSPQTREQMMALLWPDSLPQAARKNLRNVLWNIGKELGDDLIFVDGDRLSLAQSAWVDSQVFEDATPSAAEADPDELEAAAALYRGPLLEGLSLADGPEFEIWLAAERQRFGQHYQRLQEAIIAAYKESGNWTGVVDVAQQALVQDNLQESLHQALMEGYARLGERQSALRQYETWTATLSMELGVEPLPETKGLHQAILHGRFQSGAPVLAESVARPPRREERAGLAVGPTFVGRSVELAALDAEWESAGQGRVRVVALAGEIGIGKSRLWLEWSAGLGSEVTVLETHCLDTNQSHPFAPIISLLRQQPCAAHTLGAGTALSPIWLAELSRLLPELRDQRPGLPAPISLQPAEERLRLFEALYRVIDLLSSRPVVLFIDDLHWVDNATLDWLVYLTDRMTAERFMLATAYRPDDAPGKVSYALAAWQRQGVARRIDLPQLSTSESAQLLTYLGSDEFLVPDLSTRGSGNPYFLIELSRSPPGSTPPGLAELLRSRLGDLTRTVRSLLQAAAVLGSDFDFATVRAVSGQSEYEALDALDTLLEANVLLEQAGQYAFAHPLVAEVVGADLSVARCRFLHQRAAETLEKAHEDRLAPVAGQLAIHYAEAGHPAKAASYAEMAAERAMAMASPGEATMLYRQAILLEPTFSRVLALGQALLAGGDSTRANEQFQEALTAFERQGDKAAAARAAIALATGYMAVGQRNEVLRWAGRALDEYGDYLSPGLEATAHFLMGAGILGTGRQLSEAESHLQLSRELAQANALEQNALQAQFETGNLLAQRGDLDGAIDIFAKVAPAAEAADEPVQMILAFNNLAYHEQLAGRIGEADEHIQKALELTESYSLDPVLEWLYSTKGEISLAAGDLDEAAIWTEKALMAAEEAGNQGHLAGLRANRGLLAQARGDLDSALVFLQDAQNMLGEEVEPFLQTKIDLWLAEIHLQRGEQAATADALAQAEARLNGSEYEGLKQKAAGLRTKLQMEPNAG